MSGNELVKWSEIERQIAEAQDLKTITEMQEQVKALEILARQQDGSLRTQNRCSKYRIKLEQKAGQIYQELPDERGERTDLVTQGDEVTTKQSAEEETGKARQTLNRWVKEAGVNPDLVEEYEAQCNEEEKELTSAGLLHYAKSQEPEPETLPMLDGVYRVLYVDPPWKYNEQGLTGVSDTYHRKDSYGNVDKNYRQMTIEQLCEMELPKTEDNAVLFLWVTSPFLKKCFAVIEAWGFEYKASFVWDKVKHNFGYYNSVRHEFLLICTKGSCRPDNPKLYDSVQTIERTHHSEKPEALRAIIEDLYKGKKIELFARKESKEWDTWGNELESQKQNTDQY